ncbi:WD repeat-containing protein 74 [Mortierella sp. GBA35]|nr:WD repeat-containing protein 74 [Mortierella sp. AD031]KAF9108134.1 WD repeat-containing protein 74 [Mortierella sp. GBA35]KAG0215074.1 WD repeat-containing protein 74 [Mortierella sp. NVP41]
MSSQRFYTGDEQGLVKVVTITEPVVVKPKRVRRNQPTPEAPAKPVPTVETWGVPDREKAIQLMCWDFEKKHLVVARKNGLVQLLDPKDGTVTTEFKHTLGKEGKVDNIFVGLFANSESIITCTNTGRLAVQSIADHSKVTVVEVGKDICRMRVHLREHHIVATGGKEQELTIWDLKALCKDTTEEIPEPPKKGKKANKNAKASAAPAPTPAPAPTKGGSDARYKSKEILANGQLFKAKNVKNDHLDLRVPVWNTDLQFLNQYDTSRIAVGTRNHQIRVYDVKSGARRPAIDAEVGEMPVVAMANGKDGSEIVFSDTVTNVYSVDTLTGAIIGQYKGFTGVATALATFIPFEDSSNTHLVTVAMDRCLRVHEMTKTRKLLHKVYLKQRMTAVVVGEYTPAEPAEDEEEGDASKSRKRTEGDGDDDDENDDDLWESMGKLEDKKSKKRKLAKE